MRKEAWSLELPPIRITPFVPRRRTSEIKERFSGKSIPSNKRPLVSKLSPRKFSGVRYPGALKSTESSFSSLPAPRSSGDKAPIPNNPAKLNKKRRRSMQFIGFRAYGRQPPIGMRSRKSSNALRRKVAGQLAAPEQH